MRRRDFLRSALGGVVGVVAVPPEGLLDGGPLERPAPEHPSTREQAEPFTAWAWVHGNRDRTRAEWEGMVAKGALTVTSPTSDDGSVITMKATVKEDGTLSGFMSSMVGDMTWTAARQKG